MKLKHLYAFIITTIIAVLTFNCVTQAYAVSLEEESFTFLTEDYPPFGYIGQDGKPTGYSVEILQAILKELNIEANIKILPWKRAYVIAQRNKNTLLFTLTRTQKREKLFKWIGPIAPREIYLWKLKDRTNIKVDNLEDVKKYVIGSIRGDAGESQLLDMGFIINKNVIPFYDQKHIYKNIYAQRIDFTYDLEFSIFFSLKKAGLDPNKIEKSLLLSSGLEYYYGFNPNTSDLIVEEFRKALQKIKDNGTFDKIANKYKNIN